MQLVWKNNSILILTYYKNIIEAQLLVLQLSHALLLYWKVDYSLEIQNMKD